MKSYPNSHTHCQAAQANAQTKTWQRVCLFQLYDQNNRQTNGKRTKKNTEAITASKRKLGFGDY